MDKNAFEEAKTSFQDGRPASFPAISQAGCLDIGAGTVLA
jgi:hypothetical protein